MRSGGEVQRPRADMTLAFREANPGEAELLTALARKSKAGWGYPAAWQEAWASSLLVTPDYMEREVVRVAVRGGDVIGFYALVRREGGWLLDHFWVDPRWQGRGVGRSMFEHAVQHVRAAGPGVVVIEADPNAAGFYARMGAREVGHVAAPVEGDPLRRLPVFEVHVGGAAPGRGPR